MRAPGLRVAFGAWVALASALAAAGCGDRAASDRPVAVASASDAGPAIEDASAAAATDRFAAAAGAASPAPRTRDPFVPSALRRAHAAPTPRSGHSAIPAAATVSETAARRDASPGPLRGVMKREGVRYALFGERFAALGESVGGWTIIRIGENRCVLERGGRTKALEPGEAP